MRNRFTLSSTALGIALAAVLYLASFAAAQSSGGSTIGDAKTAKEKITKSPAPRTWTMPRTPDGKPDLHGYWTSMSFTPMERPAKYKGKEFLTDKETEENSKGRSAAQLRVHLRRSC